MLTNLKAYHLRILKETESHLKTAPRQLDSSSDGLFSLKSHANEADSGIARDSYRYQFSRRRPDRIWARS